MPRRLRQPRRVVITGLGCVTPAEALASHELWDAALRSAESGRAEPVG